MTRTAMMTRALCIHGHFYQPPREDPLTGVVPEEIGAAPYHNWNERIHAECYRANAELGNFERMSFNVGQFGIGNAIAQAYNHVIMPLATSADKRTQVAWGIADFAHRFGRRPRGMWLPETAVDYETLAIM